MRFPTTCMAIDQKNELSRKINCENFVNIAPQEDAPSGNIVQMTSLLPTSSTMEDASAHWGVVVGKFSESGDRCPICTLPVSKSVSDLHPGALIFQCGKLLKEHPLNNNSNRL